MEYISIGGTIRNSETFTMLVKGLTIVLYALITAFVVPWVKSRIEADKLAKIEKYAEIMVRCAEQSFRSDEYSIKKNYVLTQVTNKVNAMGIDMNISEIEALVESTVNFVKYGSEYTRG